MLSLKNIELKGPVKSFPTINLQSVAGWEYACLSQKTAYRSNLYVRALYMVVTLYITCLLYTSDAADE